MGEELPMLETLSPAPLLDDMKLEENEKTTSFANISLFLTSGMYLPGMKANQKRTLRKAATNFALINNQLYYVGRDKQKQRLVVLDDDSKKRIFKDCHAPEGAVLHCGQKKTLERIEAHFYWRSMVKDVVDWVQYCSICMDKETKRYCSPSTAKKSKLASQSAPPLADILPMECVYLVQPLPEPPNVVDNSVENVRNYVTQLEERFQAASEAEKQVTESTNKALLDIDDALDKVLGVLIRSVSRRRDELKSQVCKLRSKTLKPIKAQKKLLEIRSKVCRGLLQDADAPNAINWQTRASLLNFSLPSTQFNDTSFITTNLSLSSLDQVTSVIEQFGKVGKLSPFHLTTIAERPGALFLQWQMLEHDNESLLEETSVFTFRLEMQKAGEEAWQETYVGSSNEFIIKPLLPGVLCTFRVFAKKENDEIWGPPSTPIASCTSLPLYRFSPCFETYLLEEDCTLASRTGSGPAYLYSSSPQLQPGCEITFRFFGEGKLAEGDGIGLVEQWVQGGGLIQPGTLFLTALGSVLVNGVEVIGLAVPLWKTSQVSFVLEKVSDDLENSLLRVLISTEDKRLSVDWRLHCPTLSVYFALNLSVESVKVKVE